jgi:hypothetical protein
MAIMTPEWLARRRGELRPEVEGHGWLVYFAGEPQYTVTPIPAEGQHAFRVTQTVNGEQLKSDGVYPSVDEAVKGGLEQLRKALGW